MRFPFTVGRQKTERLRIQWLDDMLAHESVQGDTAETFNCQSQQHEPEITIETPLTHTIDKRFFGDHVHDSAASFHPGF
jgi:hypothetical protein